MKKKNREQEEMWMLDPMMGEFIPISYPTDFPLGEDMKGNLIYPDDIK